MKKLFETVRIGSLTLKNRIIRSATHEMGACENGRLTPAMLAIDEELAKGGVALIITGMLGVGANSTGSTDTGRAFGETFVPRMREICETVHKDDCLIVVQLTHCGASARIYEIGDRPWAPSETALKDGLVTHEMTTDEIAQVVADFGSAALNCKLAGVDGVQIHGAHGYLVSQFLSPYYNKRTDSYGGSIENRARFLFEVYASIRKAVGPDYPVWLKINYTDMAEPGLTAEESVWVCKELERMGIDAIEVSSGLSVDRNSRPPQMVKTTDDPGFNEQAALAVAEAVSVPVICVGGFRIPAAAEAALNRGGIAAVSLSRPLIYEPGLPNRWKSGDTAPTGCISCNRCFLSKKHGCYIQQEKAVKE